ncbi:MAG: nitroreductase family deazaflavin-dependent oxidoreductase [Myxococcales bacterium]|nr:nitroreductase family deazaflavin-dependent oxidoreductase [Myxococcales bacterium]
MSPRVRRLAEGGIRRFSQLNVWLYRKSGGKLGAHFPGGAKVCLLTTTGRKSGQPRTVPVLFLRDGDNLVVVASKGGHPSHPLWYLNLVADPRVRVEVEGETRRAHARDATESERERLWPKLVRYYEGFADYQAVTDRIIPVVILEPENA